MGKPSWKQAEERWAKRSGMRLTPGSGAGVVKGDAQNAASLAEVKSSGRHDARGHYIVLQDDWFHKALAQARLHGKDPILVFCLGPSASFAFAWHNDADDVSDMIVTRVHKTCKIYEGDLGVTEAIVVGKDVWVAVTT